MVDHERLFAQFRATHPPQRQTIDGVVWEYIAAGEGEECLLLLPGAMGVADTSFHYILAFVGTYRVLSVSYPPAIRRSTQLLQGIRALLDRENIPQVHLIGGSYSGPVAHAFACRYPGYVQSIIFANTGLPHSSWRLTLSGLLVLFALLPTLLLQIFTRWLVGWFLSAETEMEQFWRGYFLRLIPRMTREFMVNRVRVFWDLVHVSTTDVSTAWSGPVLIVTAEADDFFTADEQAALATHYPPARRLIIAAQDHGSALKAVGDHIAAYRTFLQEVAT